MDIRITPKKLTGTVTPPPSKSQAHRLLIAAALIHRGVSVIHGLADSQDIQATRRCLTALGARIDDVDENTVQVCGLGNAIVEAGPAPILDCGESGSTLRFLIPLALLVNGSACFVGHGRLMERPQGPYENLFREKGIAWSFKDGVLSVDGGKGYDDYALSPGEYRLPGNVSSQFFTGLLFVLPLLDGDSTLVPTTPLESRDYLEMTRSVLELEGLNAFSVQGDMAVVPHFLRLTHPGDLTIDLSGIPDLLPPLAVMAAVRSGTTRFVNAARLRMKESDRLATVCAMLTALGGRCEEGADSLTVTGGTLTGGTVDSAGDHRIAMAAAIAATGCTGPVTVLGAECVKKSYPDFWEVYQSLGGEVHVL